MLHDDNYTIEPIALSSCVCPYIGIFISALQWYLYNTNSDVGSAYHWSFIEKTSVMQDLNLK